jgi:hypothetical protein
MTNPNLLTIFIAITSFAVLLQACILLAILIALLKTAKLVKTATEDLKVTVIPVIHTTRELLEKISPQIQTVSQGVAELTEMVHRQSSGVKVTAVDIMDKVGKQADRLDSMVTTGLNAVEKAGMTLESAVAVPVRQANGIAAAIKAVVQTYRNFEPRRGSVRNAAEHAQAVRSAGFATPEYAEPGYSRAPVFNKVPEYIAPD